MSGVQPPGGERSAGSPARGQTLQDFTIGIGVFMLVLAATLAGFFGFLQPFSTNVDSEQVSESTRVADTMVQNLSRDHPPNELNATRTEATFDSSPTELRERWGLRNSTFFNITVETLNSSRVVDTASGETLAAGTSYENRSAASVTRIVTLSDGSCDPTCRLTVRVW